MQTLNLNNQNSISRKRNLFKSFRLGNKALAQSEGKKIQDDPDKIKKSLKDKHRQKQKSKSKWKEKTAEVEKKMQDRQEKRTENIQSRVQNKKNRKINSLKKRGRIL